MEQILQVLKVLSTQKFEVIAFFCCAPYSLILSFLPNSKHFFAAISLAVSPENSVKTETTPAPSNDHGKQWCTCLYGNPHMHIEILSKLTKFQ